MNGWQSVTNVISNLLTSTSTAGQKNHPGPLENDDGLDDAGHYTTASVLAPPGQPRNDSQRPESSAYIECLVCTSYSDEVGFSTDPPTSACCHSPEVCTECLQQVILTAINSGEFITGILCPSPECSQKLDYYDVHKWATQEVFDRYDKLLLQNSLRTDDHYVLCLEPSCAAGQVHAGGELNNIVTCHHCGSKQCFRHQVLWHEGFTCEQWDRHQQTMTSQQEMTDEWIQAETKPCPGPGCGRRIQKDEGCDHMTCRRPGGCGHQFCWECLAPWLQIIAVDNSRHYDHCQYYTGQAGNNPAPPETLAASAARDSPPPVTVHQQRPVFTLLTPQNGQLRPPARQPPVDDIPGEAQQLARLRAIFMEDWPPQGAFDGGSRERLAPRGAQPIRGLDATRNNPLPRHSQPPALPFRRVLRRGDDLPPRDARDNNDHMGRPADPYYPEVYDPYPSSGRRERPREPPNPRLAERDREPRRGQLFGTRPRPPQPPLSRTRPLHLGQGLPNGGLRPLRLVEDFRGDMRPPPTGPRSPAQPLASRYIDLSPRSALDHPPNSPFGSPPQRLEPLHMAPSTSQAVAGPGPGTQHRQNGMDPVRQAEISAWALQSNAPRAPQPNGSPAQRAIYPPIQPTTRPLRFGGPSQPRRYVPVRRPPVSGPLA